MITSGYIWWSYGPENALYRFTSYHNSMLPPQVHILLRVHLAARAVQRGVPRHALPRAGGRTRAPLRRLTAAVAREFTQFNESFDV